MLTKSICKACIKQHRSESIDPPKWDNTDEHDWYEKGAVYCPGVFSSRYTVNTGKPPHWCPFTVEHIVS